MMNAETRWKTVAELAELVGGRVVGDGGAVVKGVAAVESAREGDVVFAEDAKMIARARGCEASCVIVPEGARVEGARALIEAARPKLAFALIARELRPARRREATVHPTASVAAGATLGEGVHVGACAVVGEGARVGAWTQLLAGAV